MAGKKENIKALLSNTRSRIVILFTAILLILIVVIGFYKLGAVIVPTIDGSADVKRSPTGIRSIPGALDQTAQYAALQEEQNLEQAKTAGKTGASAIPTIIRTQAFGEGVEMIGPQDGEGGLGFTALALGDEAGAQQSVWAQALKDDNCSSASLKKVVDEGAGLSNLRPMCTCVQLKGNGYALKELASVCSCPELKIAGFGAADLKSAGFTAEKLRRCGFSACETHGAGFNAEEMSNAGFSDGELKGAGFSAQAIARASGLPDGVKEADVRKAGCTPDALKRLREQGVTAAAIVRISGCSAAQIRAAGFGAADLLAAGFSAAQLKAAGFSATELKDAGYSPRDLLNAGFTPAALQDAGFSAQDIAAGEATLPPGMTILQLKHAGCSPEAIKRAALAGVSADTVRQHAGCTLAAIRAAGCDPARLKKLKELGVTAKQIHETSGCSAAQINAAGFSAADLLAAGFTPLDLKNLGLNPVSTDAIRAAGCDPASLKKLKESGVTAKQIHEVSGCSLAQLRAASFSAKDLANAGFSPADLFAAGFSAPELSAAGLVPVAVIAAGRTADCSVVSLKAARAAGVSALIIKQTLGCSAEAMKAAGFTAAELKDAGFSAAELKAAGYSAADLKAGNAGFSDEELKGAGFSAESIARANGLPDGVKEADVRKVGCTPDALKRLREQGVTAAAIVRISGCSAAKIRAAGFGAPDLLAAGFSAAQLKAAGFSAAELKAGGYSASDLLNAGFTAADLQNARFSPQDIAVAVATAPPGITALQLKKSGRTADCSVASLKAARSAGVSALTIKQTLGCSAEAMKAGGYTSAELKNAGFSAAELKAVGFSAADLNAAGFTAKALKDAGFSAADLKAAGVSAKALRDSGFSAAELKASGFRVNELTEAGFGAKDLKAAGFSAKSLLDAGVSVADLKAAGLSQADLKAAGVSEQELQQEGFPAVKSSVPSLDTIPALVVTPVSTGLSFGGKGVDSAEKTNVKQLKTVMDRQQLQMADQRYQAKIKQRSTAMMSAVKELLSDMKKTPNQVFIGGPEKKESSAASAAQAGGVAGGAQTTIVAESAHASVIRTGDILFAVMDTSVNTDEPGPILASIVSGRLKGAKLIGSFTLPSNADKMIISFNTLSMPGADKTISISAFAIDPDTARTALSSQTNHHYLQRYGALFASSFMQGMSSAVQSSNTTVSIGGTGGTTDTTVSTLGRSTLDNVMIGLGQVGQAWAKTAQKQMNRPTTIEVYAGTGLGILFTQDVTIL